MGSDDWYRNACWDAETAAAFDTRLARSRTNKAQYLRIQGSILTKIHPDAAIGLLQRCIDEGDDFQTAPAYLEMAHAHYFRKDVAEALAALEAAIEQQERLPISRTSAACDFAFLVALHGREECYDRALDLLDREGSGFFASMVFEAQCAKALILSARGQHEQARRAALDALSAADVKAGWIPGHPEVGTVPATENPLFGRLRQIATAGRSS